MFLSINWASFTWWMWTLFVMYCLYLVLYLYVLYNVFYKEFPSYKELKQENKDKYSMFIRIDYDSINCSLFLILCGLTLGYVRFYLWFVTMILSFILLRILWCCSDPEKPLGKCRRCIIKFLV